MTVPLCGNISSVPSAGKANRRVGAFCCGILAAHWTNSQIASIPLLHAIWSQTAAYRPHVPWTEYTFKNAKDGLYGVRSIGSEHGPRTKMAGCTEYRTPSPVGRTRDKGRQDGGSYYYGALCTEYSVPYSRISCPSLSARTMTTVLYLLHVLYGEGTPPSRHVRVIAESHPRRNDGYRRGKPGCHICEWNQHGQALEPLNPKLHD